MVALLIEIIEEEAHSLINLFLSTIKLLANFSIAKSNNAILKLTQITLFYNLIALNI